jgi:competence protein ComEA
MKYLAFILSFMVNSLVWAYGPVDINHASKKELEGLKGIGPTLASRIIERRETKGSFSSVYELVEIKGISKNWVEKNREQLELVEK